ncbi:hypothetical protein TIFTF001_041304 [Ficus carica]|uniref:Terpene synthase N-terminal domain-containing protein n=1 Tax=Ficus carica TaxID=3494 RepID=A0AA87ZD16_FICCA|nr:hypothetical protein TIFTF001_041304 [Ficus carica]
MFTNDNVHDKSKIKFKVGSWFELDWAGRPNHSMAVRHGIFQKFTNEQGKFNNALTSDAQGMLSLCEAAHLMVHGEPILEEALAFTTTHLKTSMTSSQLSPFLLHK